MGQLINGASTASAILDRQDGRDGRALPPRLHRRPAGGPDPGRPVVRRIVIGRDRTGYIEDLGLRPDLVDPPAARGPAVRLRAGLPAAGAGPARSARSRCTAGTRGAWTDGHVALLESLAAQTSVSLEAAHLFESVQQERLRLEAVLRAVPIGIAVAQRRLHRHPPEPRRRGPVRRPAGHELRDAGRARRRRAVIDGRTVTADDFPLPGRVPRGAARSTRSRRTCYLPGNRRLILLINAAPIRERRPADRRGRRRSWTSPRRRSCSASWTSAAARPRRRASARPASWPPSATTSARRPTRSACWPS